MQSNDDSIVYSITSGTRRRFSESERYSSLQSDLLPHTNSGRRFVPHFPMYELNTQVYADVALFSVVHFGSRRDTVGAFAVFSDETSVTDFWEPINSQFLALMSAHAGGYHPSIYPECVPWCSTLLLHPLFSGDRELIENIQICLSLAFVRRVRTSLKS